MTNEQMEILTKFFMMERAEAHGDIATQSAINKILDGLYDLAHVQQKRK